MLDTKGTSHARMGIIKDRNDKDLREAEDIKKRWQEYTELYEKDLHDSDNHDDNHDHSPRARQPGMWSQVGFRKHYYEQNYGIPAELLQILKDDALKVLHSTCQQIWKTQPWPQDWTNSVFIPTLKKNNAKEMSNYFKLPHNCTHFSC